MSTLTMDLQATLKELDSDSATKLERLVRDAIDLAQPSKAKPASAGAVDKNGWPAGFFEETAGSFANEPFDFPTDLPLEPIANW